MFYSNVRGYDSKTDPHRVTSLYYYLLPIGVIPDSFIPHTDEAMYKGLEAASQYNSQGVSDDLMAYFTSMCFFYHRKMGVQLPKGFKYAGAFRSASAVCIDPCL